MCILMPQQPHGYDALAMPVCSWDAWHGWVGLLWSQEQRHGVPCMVCALAVSVCGSHVHMPRNVHAVVHRVQLGCVCKGDSVMPTAK